MHPQEPQEFEFTLDDIIREFSDSPAEELPQELVSDPEPLPTFEPPVAPAYLTPSEETVRLETVETPAPVAPIGQETAVFTPVSQDTAVFSPLTQETMSFFNMPDFAPEPELEPETEPEAQEEEAEPFSDEWEPEYEEPMGDYPQPIAFPQKNRQTTLRKKLVAGPEKRFHALAAQGIAGVKLGIFLQFILFVVSAAGTALYLLDMVNPSQQRLLIFGQVIVAMVAGLLGCYRLLVGLGSLLRGRLTLNTLLFVAFAACMVDGYFCLGTLRLPFTTILCLELLMAQCAEYQRRDTQMSQMDTLRKALEVTALVKITDYHEGKPGYVAMEGDPDAFMQEYYKPTGPERRLELFALLALLASIGLSVYIGLNVNWQKATQVLSAALLAAVPASSLIIISRPIAVLEKRLHKLGAVLCGWKGIRLADQQAVFPLEHNDLFPPECAKMNGVKFYGSFDPGRVVAYSTALIAQDGKGMMRVFSHLPRSRNIQNYRVTEFVAYPGGISGLVDGWSVMVGTQEFLTEMGVSVPQDARVQQAVYAAVDGQFSAVFALQYSRSKSSAAGIRTLCAYRGIKTVLVATDFILTDRFIHNRVGVNVNRVIFPDRETRQHLAATPIPEDPKVMALVVKSGLAPKAYALTGARALRATLNIGSIVHILAGVAGLAAVAVLAVTGSYDALNVQNLLGYSLVWMVPGFMITEWTRHI